MELALACCLGFVVIVGSTILILAMIRLSGYKSMDEEDRGIPRCGDSMASRKRAA